VAPSILIGVLLFASLLPRPTAIKFLVGLTLGGASTIQIWLIHFGHGLGYIQAHGGAIPAMSLTEIGRSLLLTSPAWLILYLIAVATFGARTMLKAAPWIAAAILLSLFS
jgi:hypothetical protein